MSLSERGTTEVYEGFMVLSLPYETACIPGECYGAMTVYMRLQKLTPPSSAGRGGQGKGGPGGGKGGPGGKQ